MAKSILEFMQGQISIGFMIDSIETDSAGTQRQLLETLTRLERRLFKPLLLCLYESEWMKQNLLPCETVVLGYKGFLKPNFVKVVGRLAQVLKDKRIDILQTFFEDSIFVGYLGGLLSRRRPVLLSSRRDIGLGEDRPWYHKLYGLALPFVNLGFDGIVVNGQEIKRYVSKKERVPYGRIRVIPNGIEIPSVMEPEPEIFSEAGDKVWITMVASLTPIKRHDVFLRALSILQVLEPGLAFQALILGEGPERDRLMRMGKELRISSNVKFAGAVRNVTAYLRRTDIGVLCSDREGLSNAILEYMACGLPVIASDAGGNLELVDSTNGILFPRGDAEALAKALGVLIRDREKRKRMGGRSLEKVKASYSWERTMEELQNYYQELAAAKGKKSSSLCRLAI